MLAVTRLAGVTPEMNLRNNLQARKHTSIHPGFETQGRRHQKSKTGVSVAPQKAQVRLTARCTVAPLVDQREEVGFKSILPICRQPCVGIVFMISQT